MEDNTWIVCLVSVALVKALWLLILRDCDDDDDDDVSCFRWSDMMYIIVFRCLSPSMLDTFCQM